ncbi:MAG: MerR family transcriptional regulator [Rhodospirillales bacterium]|nr:MerR family transcriptional regulator [Alphaproteobacteria bacterium]MBL6947731.1 MerR family transcriptional regulator [Rhodospirillales bacterium]
MTAAGENSAPKSAPKSDRAFRTISEVSADLDLPQHVLRFWETKFTSVKPMKRGGGRRFYRPEDMALLERIRGLLYDDGYTIKGVQKLLREGGGKLPAAEPEPAPSSSGAPSPDDTERQLDNHQRQELQSILGELESIRAELLAAKTPA